MKLLIIVPRNLTSDEINYKYLFPLGLAYISSVLKKDGHDVDILILNHYRGNAGSLIGDKLSNKQYDYALTGGLSVAYNQVKMVVDAVRKSANAAGIILGGGLGSSEPELMFDSIKPDYIVMGEGENTVCELLKCLGNKGNIEDVAGIGYRGKDGKFALTGPATPIENLDAIPYPDFESFEFDKYLDNMQPNDQYFYDLFDYPRMYPIICSRSCPFLCTFCFHPVGNKYRQRSVDSIMDELTIMVKKYRINVIAIYDELFSNNRAWLMEFCKRFKEFAKGLEWECRWGCQMRVDKLDEEMLQAMKDSGCYTVSYGFESYSPVVLRSMKKHITPQQIKNAVDLTLKIGLSLQGNFLFGDPAETKETAAETLDYWKKNNNAGIMLTFINPYPGTDIYRSCFERGVIKDRLDFIANHIFDVFNMTEKMTDKEFEKLKRDVSEAENRYRFYAVPDSVTRTENGTCDIEITCPHCKKHMIYRNYHVSYIVSLFFLMYCRNCRRRFFIVSRSYRIILKLTAFLDGILPFKLKKAIHLGFHKAAVVKPLIKKYILKYL